ncbi:MAG: diphthamide synthesis protein [Nanoarchaeota archaeon]
MTDIFFVDSVWENELVLTPEILEHLQAKKVRSLALFASAQFLKVDKIIEQLRAIGVQAVGTKAKRTNTVMQLLGCDIYHNSFEEDIIEGTDATLFIGDGLFHPKTLLLAQMNKKSIKEVIVFDPVQQRMRVLNHEIIQDQIRKARANLKSYLAASSVGILVSVKPGQSYINSALQLKQQVEAQGKKAYVFIDNTIDLLHIENYPFIDCWVNTACPRIGSDDMLTIRKPLINIREAFDPARALEMLYLG